jgi:hypothetical protein
MARTRSTDRDSAGVDSGEVGHLAATPHEGVGSGEVGEVPSKVIREVLNRQIIREYVTEFKMTRTNRDGSRIKDHLLWSDLAQTLGLSYAARRRYAMGVDKYGKRPESALDGQEDRYEPGFEEVFRYIAALDLAVTFPRGRVIVNRAVARVLSGIRRVHSGEVHPLTATEVERLRFLRNWVAAQRSSPGISMVTVQEMEESEFFDLMGPIRFSESFLEGLKRLYADWNVFYDELRAFTYPWIDYPKGAGHGGPAR